MTTYGRQVLFQTGTDLQVTADGAPEWHPIGITIDWSTVAAVSGSDETYGDGTVVKIGQKGLPYGQVLCRINVAEVQTVTLTGNPTGGTFTLSGNGETTDPIAYNAAAATVQTEIRALGGDYSEVVVTGSAGGPWTVTFPLAAGNPAQLTGDGGGLTGGTSPDVSIATTTSGSSGAGKWGPYASGASDGRQNLTRGNCVILNRTLLEEGFAGVVAVAGEHIGAIEGGLVWKSRIRAGGSGQPSWQNLEAALPRLRYVEE
jgi:hypothetical protein